ncbi:N2,N2-dimethylguanosine tRNA methyltransferase family protein [Cryptosporidium muris RN66]|uniref:tRNA (guanine(26)-N(2))-dimethyltransferase n=1 Tax=Cryptosporidium muris (strain RN66) TaxID=441375 RepID=B6AD78_CRYMR|nr:N2,N2-dimethylguanosine tRNA methyltransferase family protein [Cryptosporidium muris RN66]EEA06082.1 N2,N2-dimethylguanosine tRNA methyltransferase family protein [Cryptosporidium muris RN66]|eukprot:XP_002140431.1 N2,N2-dimethylguanosine tRNA methyltransferase family protein [Cryptosporidium muris RN66]
MNVEQSELAEAKCSDYIHEGKVKIYALNNEVFYNSAQIFNRDLSLIVIKAFSIKRSQDRIKQLSEKKLDTSGNLNKSLRIESHTIKDEDLTKKVESQEKLTIIEPLGASGLRSLRYIIELADEVDFVVCGDHDPIAIKQMERNVSLNGVDTNKLVCICADATRLLSLGNPKFIREFTSMINKSIISGSSSWHSNLLNNILKPNSTLKYSVVDIDPYGTCSPFIESAISACENGGMVCFTSTDMPVLCGNMPEVTFYRYGGNALKSSYMHEMSLRLLLNAIMSCAAKYQKGVIPLISCSVDFYVRIFVQIVHSPIICKQLAQKTSIVLQCTNCPSFHVIPFGKSQPKKKRRHNISIDGGNNEELKDEISISPNVSSQLKYKPNNLKVPVSSTINSTPILEENSLCCECGSGHYVIGGPFYSGPLFDPDFLNKLLIICSDIQEKKISSLQNITMLKKIKGLLLSMKDELSDSPLHYHIPSMCTFLNLEMMKPSLFHSALRHLGYISSHFHRDPLSLKTNAPNQVVMDILRTWALEHPPKNSQYHKFLQKPISTLNIKFEIHPCILLASKVGPRWLPNPEDNWGPKSRPGNNSKKKKVKHNIL